MNLVSLCFFAPLQFTVHYSTESGLFLDPDTNEGEVLTYPSGSLHDSSERWIKEVDLTDKTGIDRRGSIICDMSAGILDWDLLYLPPADLIYQLSCLQEPQGSKNGLSQSVTLTYILWHISDVHPHATVS